MLPKADLNEIEEVTAEQVPRDFARAEANLQIESAKIGMKKENLVNGRSKVVSRSGLVDNARPGEDVDSQRQTDPAVQQGTLGSGVEICLHVDGFGFARGVGDPPLQSGESIPVEIVRVLKLVLVRDGNQVSQPHPDDAGTRRFDVEHIGNPHALRASLLHQLRRIPPVDDDLLAFYDEPLAREAA